MKNKENSTKTQHPDAVDRLDFLTHWVERGREKQHVREVNQAFAQRPRLRAPEHNPN